MYTRRKTVILFLTFIIASFISVFLISFKKTDIVYAESFDIQPDSDIFRSLYVENLAKDDPVRFTITAKNDKILSDNSILLRSLTDDTAGIELTNPYQQSLHLAKHNWGVIC